jgi:hypothetical protein
LFKDPNFKNYGAVKIVPPFMPEKSSFDEASFIKERRVESPLLQLASGSNGHFQMELRVKKSM